MNNSNTTDSIIKASLTKSISYPDYRTLVSKLVAEQRTTGQEQTEALINYTMLNDRRMKRWDKTVKVSEATQDAFKAITSPMTWLVITESWCGDAAHVMPVLYKLSQLNDALTFKVVLRDEHPELMDRFLTAGSRSIPKLIIIDDSTHAVTATYGPRPSTATQMVKDYKAKHGTLSAAFKEDLQRWYNKDKGQTIISDMAALV